MALNTPVLSSYGFSVNFIVNQRVKCIFEAILETSLLKQTIDTVNSYLEKVSRRPFSSFGVLIYHTKPRVNVIILIFFSLSTQKARDRVTTS